MSRLNGSAVARPVSTGGGFLAKLQVLCVDLIEDVRLVGLTSRAVVGTAGRRRRVDPCVSGYRDVPLPDAE